MNSDSHIFDAVRQKVKIFSSKFYSEYFFHAYPLKQSIASSLQIIIFKKHINKIPIHCLGCKVATSMNGELKAGILYQATFDARNLASGLYFCRLESKNNSLTKTLTYQIQFFKSHYCNADIPNSLNTQINYAVRSFLHFIDIAILILT